MKNKTSIQLDIDKHNGYPLLREAFKRFMKRFLARSIIFVGWSIMVLLGVCVIAFSISKASHHSAYEIWQYAWPRLTTLAALVLVFVVWDWAKATLKK